MAAAAAAALAYGVERLLAEIVDGSAAVVMALPAVGLLVNALVRRFAGRHCGPATVDAYIDALHGVPFDLGANSARVVGSSATVGLGAALDTAGGGIALGATIGEVARRWSRAAGSDLLIVGAAAGLGAALSSPVAGAMIAVEVPFRHGANWRRLPIALAGSGAGYVARGLIDDFTVPFRTDIGVVGVRDIVVALVLAVAAGFASRAMAWVATSAERGLGPVYRREWQHVVAGGLALAALAAIGRSNDSHIPVTLGPGDSTALVWTATASLGGLLAVLALRAAATGASVLGRGSGGLFVPLIVMGYLAGHIVGDLADGNLGLLQIIGAATLLAAGYRIPFAAVIWLVETTHSVPAIAVGGVAVLIAHSVGGGRSVCSAQRPPPHPAP